MPNRNQLLSELGCRLESGDQLALMVLKIRKLGEINIAYGYKLGDSYLEYAETMIRRAVRRTDWVARVGDNEFGIIIDTRKNPSIAVLAANKLINIFGEGASIEDAVIIPDVAIGIVLANDKQQDRDHYEMMTRAGIALSMAESSDRRYVIYDEDPDEGMPALLFENEIHNAYHNDEFELYYQPQIDLQTGELTGAEALIRWNSPKLGPVNTQLFVDALEQTSLMLDVTKWVLNRSILQFSECADIKPDFDVAVNIPASLLLDEYVVQLATYAANIWSKATSNITIEVTESVIMEDPEASKNMLQRFISAGFNVSIDDFGTGYSSLEYLKDLPATKMKIDRSFVMNMANSPKDRNIVKAVIELAHALELKVVAEGIEDRESYDALVAMGCDQAQGYYIARPMSYDDFMEWVQTSQWSGQRSASA